MADKKEIKSTPPSLVGKKHYLRPASPDDIKKCYHWVTLAEPQSFSCQAEPIMSAAEASEQYKNKTKSDSSQTFMIVLKDDNAPIGVIVYDNLNSLNRSAEISWYLDPDDDLELKPAEGIELLLGYLFAYRNLNKVATSVRDGDKERVKLIEKIGFKKEGTLRQHHFFENKLHDVHLYSILRFEYGVKE